MKLILLVAYWLVCSAPCAMGQATAPLYACEAITLPDATRLVEVASDAQLQTAIDDAQPGDRIVLADGNYDGFYVLNVKLTMLIKACYTSHRTATTSRSSATTFMITLRYSTISAKASTWE